MNQPAFLVNFQGNTGVINFSTSKKKKGDQFHQLIDYVSWRTRGSAVAIRYE